MKKVAKENLLQLKDLANRMKKEDYISKPDILSNASIGQHMRHILEFYTLLIAGTNTGIISYDKRERDIRLENEPSFANETINNIIDNLQGIELNKSIKLEADYTIDKSSNNLINSSIARELAYCIEHSIHHQAIIKTGLIALGLTNLITDHFGVAYSTIRYRKESCAQ